MATIELKHRILHLVIDEADDGVLDAVLQLLERKAGPADEQYTSEQLAEIDRSRTQLRNGERIEAAEVLARLGRSE